VPERIAIVGTGGISHWPATPDSGRINEAWDRAFLEASSRMTRRRCSPTATRRPIARRAGRLRDPHLRRDRGRRGRCARRALVLRYAPIPIFAVGCTVATFGVG
jgi:2,3-dihydroxyphenylpropionate 1,2-dioxygenase